MKVVDRLTIHGQVIDRRSSETTIFLTTDKLKNENDVNDFISKALKQSESKVVCKQNDTDERQILKITEIPPPKSDDKKGPTKSKRNLKTFKIRTPKMQDMYFVSKTQDGKELKKDVIVTLFETSGKFKKICNGRGSISRQIPRYAHSHFQELQNLAYEIQQSSTKSKKIST